MYICIMILRKKIEITDDQNIFFCSDIHFWHNNIIKFDKRPFKHIVEMNETIILNWQNTVKDNDIVFYLGDFAFSSNKKMNDIAWRLTGKIHFILGNHDRAHKIENTGRFEGVYDYGEIWVKNVEEKNYQHIVMSHFPFLVWNKHHRGSWMLHGHSHNNMRRSQVEYYKRKVEDVGINYWDYTPVSYQKIESAMKNKDIDNIDHH